MHATVRPTTLLKKRLWHRCFPVNFVKFRRTPFYIEYLWTTGTIIRGFHHPKSPTHCQHDSNFGRNYVLISWNEYVTLKLYILLCTICHNLYGLHYPGTNQVQIECFSCQRQQHMKESLISRTGLIPNCTTKYF